MMLTHILFEIIIVSVVVVLAWLGGNITRTGISAAKRIASGVHRQWFHMPALVAVIAFAISIAISARRLPAPEVHDEFSYLLAADTYSHGRLANPTHPMWPHFEAFHVIQQPSYASKFPPGQGALLAIGQCLTGAPIVGSWIGVAMASATVCWMLCGWTRPRWALLGGLLVAANASLQTQWGQRYWGGLVPLSGSALMFGALPRLARNMNVRDSLVMALGAAILAVSRPFEGFVVFVPAMAGLFAIIRNSQASWLAVTRNVLIPGGLVLSGTTAFLLYFNLCVAGAPLTSPYAVHHVQYEVSPLLLFLTPREVPNYHNAVIERAFSKVFYAEYLANRTWNGFVHLKLEMAWFIWLRYVGMLLTIPLVMTLPRLCTQPRYRYLMLVLAGAFAVELSVCWLQAHYLAAVGPLAIILTVAASRQVWAAWGRRHQTLFAGAIAAYFIFSGLHICSYAMTVPRSWQSERVEIANRLLSLPGNHLVVVHYQPNHNIHFDWIANSADIDASRVVWARELDPAANSKLLKYFHDRRVWLVLADAMPPQLIELDPNTGQRLNVAPPKWKPIANPDVANSVTLN